MQEEWSAKVFSFNMGGINIQLRVRSLKDFASNTVTHVQLGLCAHKTRFNPKTASYLRLHHLSHPPYPINRPLLHIDLNTFFS